MTKSLTKNLDRVLDNYKVYNSKYTRVFTVGNTRVKSNSNVYFTPMRLSGRYIVQGVVVFSEAEAKEILTYIDGKVKYIFVDAEKKSKNINEAGLFNLERLATEVIQTSTLNFYKGNDITIDAIDSFILSWYRNKKSLIGGKKALIIGLGNIGFKIGLKLVERGCDVYFKSSDNRKAKLFSDVINAVKPNETIATVKLFDYTKCDMILMTGLDASISNDKIFENLTDSQTLVLDVGKGCVSNHQVKLIEHSSSTVYRLDIGWTFSSKIESIIEGTANFNLPRTKIMSNGTKLIEPGIVGKKGSVVVNNIDAVSENLVVYGICDGVGGLDSSRNIEIYENISNGF